MILKLSLLLATLTLAVVSAASTHNFTLFHNSIISGQELKPGDYKLQLRDDNKAVISKGKQTVEANVKVETADSKFSSTSVRFQNGDGKYRVQEIRLGGTTTKVVFDN